jgi:ABC-type Fe3+/spermidine/putrescine transport system ATPase subunit
MNSAPAKHSGDSVGLEVKNLFARYDASAAINDVSFSIRPTELVTLLGPSGCGKSTTLRCVAGLHRVAGGTITIGDDLVAGPRVHVRPEHRRVNMVFQSYAIWPHMSVFENVAYGLKSMKLASGEIKSVVHAMLELVGLEGLAERPATGLSGGQQQRVALARAIATRPRVLLLDEPLSNLDSVLRARMRTEMQRIQRETGTTTLYVTHDCGEALSMSDQIVVLNQGRIAQIGRPEELYDRPASRFVARFLGFANFVSAKVSAVAGGQIDVIAVGLDGAPHFQLPQSQSSPLREGQPLDLVMRPESLMINRPGTASSANAFAATLVKRDFLGGKSELTFRSGNVLLRCDADRDFLNRIDGEAAVLSIAPHHLTWVPQEPTDATDQP